MPSRSHQPEAQPEVAHEVARPLGPAGQPRRTDEADPQAEEGGDDVPLRRDRRGGDRLHLGRRLARDGAGDEREDQRRQLADEEADDGVDEPRPALAFGLRRHPRRVEEGGVDERDRRRGRRAHRAADRGRHAVRAGRLRRGGRVVRRWGRRRTLCPILAGDSRPGRAPGAGPAARAAPKPRRRARCRSSGKRYCRLVGPGPAGRAARREQRGGHRHAGAAPSM